MLSIKSSHEITIMRKAGQILSCIRTELLNFLKIGVSTFELDMIAFELMKKNGVVSAFKDYQGFGGHICISVNEAVVHGLPSKKKILKNGDIVTIDLGIKYKGYFVDSAYTYILGTVPMKVKRFIENTEKALYLGINQIKPGNKISDISYAIAEIGRIHNYGIIEVFSGHGIGTRLHEEPYIFNFKFVDKDYILVPGMTFCVEPMFTLGSKEVKILKDGWTAITSDLSLSAHFEHTILVTDEGYDILT
ncbi:type I methionyl aminopeptidase [Columbia Basin potato purple top phytoplasma]|uniref:Methionine aminopeptidase n=1 Tax=Columbia Basin potato purple top phytoplasma TaxID=307134 RepID=A0ABT5L8I2_9MOLU|nr:type I methionyl aminopeptidase [Columbia Basin potato purple top phytoplasma]MDC9031964.1 methionine aminopeptidase [Columbia Basin potato purple top phytoplasma]